MSLGRKGYVKGMGRQRSLEAMEGEKFTIRSDLNVLMWQTAINEWYIKTCSTSKVLIIIAVNHRSG
jgi:hypothetical protein